MAQFPTNNYDSTHGGVDENNNPNTPEIANANKGKARTGNALYSDKHYLDGDGFLYGLGMASLRQIVKGKNDDLTKYFYWSAGKSTASQLGLNIPAIAGDLAGAGLLPTAGTLNLMFYTKKNGSVNESGLIIPEESTTYASGLKINCGKALSIGVDSTDAAAYGKLNVLYDNITIKLDNQNRLKVDTAAITPNILPSGPITVDTSGNNKTIGLKLKNTTESGHTIYASGLDFDSNGLFVKLGGNSIANGDNGLFVDWSIFPKGNGIYYNEQTGLFETDIDPTAGLTFTPSGSVVINLSASTGNNPLIFNQTDGGLDLVFDDSLRGNGTYGMASGETGLGVSLYRSASGTNLSGIEFVSGDSTHDPGLKIKLGNNSNLSINSNGISVTTASSITSTDTKPATSKAVYDAIAAAVADLEAADFEFVIAPSLPTASATYKQKIYLIPLSGASTLDTYEEYVCINTGSTASPSYQWENIGDTSFTTDNFVAKTDVLTQAEVASIVQDVFGF